jgi:hypothetical protein
MQIAVALATGVLTSCAGSSVTRKASGGQGASLDLWVNFGFPKTGIPSGYVDGAAVAELTFLSIRGNQGVQVFVCNQHTKLTAIEIDDLGPDCSGFLLAVPFT